MKINKAQIIVFNLLLFLGLVVSFIQWQFKLFPSSLVEIILLVEFCGLVMLLIWAIIENSRKRS